ncbi:MAG: MFS transporter [Proteobacteria bacterium]|nr:MFS transporter [Pseudomonadota bacterium]
MLGYIVSYVDRQILTQLVGPIRADLGITDTQFSLLHGLAFALFYTIMGIPIARLADRRSRRAVVVSGVAFWSVMTGICGMASNFWQLFAARVGVGIGEAALSPAAYSMISDLFPKERRGAALGLYSAGAFLGIGFAFMIGAFVISKLQGIDVVTLPLVGDVRPWQSVFFIVGFPGLLAAGLLLTVREPVRRDSLAAAKGQPSSIGDLLDFLKLNRATILTHFLGFSTITLVFNGILTWAPAYFDRRHGIPVQDSGTPLGLIVVVFGTAGIFLGGVLSDHYLSKGKTHGPLIVGLISASVLVPVAGTLSLVENPMISMAIFAPFVFFVGFPFAAAIAGLQMITPNRLRAQVGALYLFFINLTGIGFGGTFTALFTDYVFGSDQMLHYSMAIVGAGARL